jgi:hypothetical protein
MDNKINEVLASQLDADWASNLIQILGYAQGHTPTPTRAKAFLNALIAGEPERKLAFASNPSLLSLIRIAVQNWREPGIGFADLRALVHTKGDNDNAISFSYEGETIVVVLKDYGVGYLVATEVGRFSHYVQNDAVPNPSEEWAKAICSIVHLIKQAGYKNWGGKR